MGPVANWAVRATAAYLAPKALLLAAYPRPRRHLLVVKPETGRDWHSRRLATVGRRSSQIPSTVACIMCAVWPHDGLDRVMAPYALLQWNLLASA